MRLGFRLAFAATALMAGPAFAGEDAPPQVRHETARILQSEFKYAPAAPAPFETVAPRDVSTAGEVIAMPKFTVLSSRINMRELERDIVRNQARAVAQKPKWGCGPIYQKDFGKVRFAVVSIFYIPIAIGLSW